MADEKFGSHSPSLTSPGDDHFTLPANTTELTVRPKAIYCHAAGTINVIGKDGTSLPYTLAVGQWLPFRGTGTGAITGTFYGWV